MDPEPKRIRWWEVYTARNFGSLDNNPSPGSKRGGLTKILEKSLGAVAKGGTSPLNGIYLYGEQVDRKGFVFMDSPGYDPCSVTGQIASGCNIVCFTTGRGSAFGAKPSPSIKIATNTDMYERMAEDMDINAGRIVTDNASVQEVGEEIFRRILDVASGAPSLSEAQGARRSGIRALAGRRDHVEGRQADCDLRMRPPGLGSCGKLRSLSRSISAVDWKATSRCFFMAWRERSGSRELSARMMSR